ncbi:hypothetical protein [Tenacibaculum agarivorans]|uniref:hypothetical protein n=1 Tax=Tenacibaculum agarivorans TaxID=1908389 RepID=UPI00094BB955|nr:hypothetical protein [Tenacibaculum agarivorans]
MKKIIILVVSLIIFSNCTNDENNINETGNEKIIGEWKLIESKFHGLEGGTYSEGSIDHSNENIIYNFQPNGKLLVTGGNNPGYPNREYDYVFGEDYLSGSSSPGEKKILLVKIDNTKWTYNFTDGRMTLGISYVDGPDLIFERK